MGPDFNYTANTASKTGAAGNFAVTQTERRTDKSGGFIPTNAIKLSQHIHCYDTFHCIQGSRPEMWSSVSKGLRLALRVSFLVQE